MERAILVNADLHQSKIWGVLSDANLMGANLQEAFLNGADLRNASLEGACLQRADLHRSDLQGARTRAAKLDEAHLYKANLKDSSFTSAQLASANNLLAATMPDGSTYDGRYCLVGDLEMAGIKGIDTNDSTSMASFYGVSLERYLEGQGWARENLPKLEENY